MPKFKIGDEIRVTRANGEILPKGTIRFIRIVYDNYVVVGCACCPQSYNANVVMDDIELIPTKTLLETLDNPNEMFKFLKRELDISN